MIKLVKEKFKNSVFFKVIICLYCISCIYFFIVYSNILHTEPTIIYNEKFEVKKGQKVKNTFFIKEVKYGKIVSKEYYINTSKKGKQLISITIKNIYGKEKKYDFNIKVT